MWVKLLLLFLCFSFLFRGDYSFDQDLGRHIKLGEIISQAHQIPRLNLFSYTNPDFPFINSHWLFEVIAYFFAATGTLQLFLALKILIFLLSVWLVMKNNKSVLLLPVGFIFLHVLRERLELRPEIFSFLFTAISIYILERFLKKKTDWILILPVIQLLWINTHIYFFIGLMLQVTYIIYIGYQNLRSHLTSGKFKLLAIIFGLSVAVCLINPNGLAGLLYPLNVTKNYGYTIVENQTLFLLEAINFRNPNFLFVKLSVGLVVLSLFTALVRRSINIKNIFLSISGVILALMNVRSFPYLVFLSLPATLANFGTINSSRLTKTATIVFAGILLLESYFYLNGDYYRYTDSQHQVGLKLVESGKGALDFVLNNNLPGPIYNNFDIGSYIIYRGYPKYRVFVDGRPEAFPKQFFQQIYIPTQSDYSKFKELEKKWQFKTIIFSHTDQTPWGRAFLQSLMKDQSWKLVYIDDFMLVFVKDDIATQRNLNVIDPAKLNPDSFKFESYMSNLRTGIFLLSTGNAQSGAQFITKSLQIFPGSPIANSIMGNPTKQKFFW